jgi:hypothetical protein
LLDFTDQIFTVGFAAGGTGMPCRHAYWYLLTAFPLAGLAFWPNYLSQFATSPLEFHMHGITASLWLTLLVFQSWTIQNGQREMHRQTGVLSLGLFPAVPSWRSVDLRRDGTSLCCPHAGGMPSIGLTSKASGRSS